MIRDRENSLYDLSSQANSRGRGMHGIWTSFESRWSEPALVQDAWKVMPKRPASFGYRPQKVGTYSRFGTGRKGLDDLG